MRMRDALVLLSVAVLAACGRPPGAQVKMRGLTPNTSLQKDLREIRCTCPSCGLMIEAGTEKCPDQKNCKARIDWNEEEGYPCGYCTGSGKCQACVLMEKEGGKCFNCKGAGYLTFQGQTPKCADCKGDGKCTICKGTQNCDFCGGTKKVSLEVVKAKARKPGEGREEGVEEKKPAPPPPEKKAEDAKPPEKAEEKKEEAKPADK